MGQVTDREPLLSVRELSLGFPNGGQYLRAVDRASFDVSVGETLGVVGESGCGKSLTLRSLIGLQRPAEILGGSAMFRGRDLLQLTDKELMEVRESQVAMIFQDPASALNPLLTVGGQVAEVLRVKRDMSRKEAAAEAVILLDRVGIASAERRTRDYPHQLSGGMRQRVMIAIAIACNPALLLADEPTTALDVTIQDQILALLEDLRVTYEMALILVSHDLGVIAEACDQVAVMYAGRVVEYGTVSDVLAAPQHPYTEALLNSVPPLDPSASQERLRTVGGQPPQLGNAPAGCSFAPRCSYAEPRCGEASMELVPGLPDHGTACLFPERVGTRA